MTAATSTDDLLRAIFEELAGGAEAAPPTRRIVVISTPRSGSSLFAERLEASGAFGRPMEWLNTRYLSAYAQLTGNANVNLDEYWNFVQRRTATANGVFSVKIHVEHFLEWKQRGFDLRQLAWTGALFVSRRDKLAQAWSLAKARYTDQWSSHTAPSRRVPEQGLPLPHITGALHDIVSHEWVYRSEMAALGAREYVYEDFADDSGLAAEVLPALGIAVADLRPLERGLQRQTGGSDRAHLAAIRQALGL